MEKSSTLENIGQSNLYSFHNFISLSFPHLHLTECKPGLISIAQVSTSILLINILDAIAERKNPSFVIFFLPLYTEQPFLQLEHTGKKNQLQWSCIKIKHYQVRELARVKALFCCMARSQILGAR